MPVASRATAGRLDLGQRDRLEARAPAPPLRPPAPLAGAGRASSTSVFHSPQPGQRPCHFGLSWPQAEQL